MTAVRPDKAVSYLVEGRVVLVEVGPAAVDARVRGDGAVYRTGWSRTRGWACDCPARTRCAHLRAVGLVVAVQEHRIHRTTDPSEDR